MSDCGVCVMADCDEPFEFSVRTFPVARKEHKCSECNKVIQRGEKYERVVGKYDGDIEAFKTCLVCAEIADTFSCDGRMYGGYFWESFDEGECWQALTTGCFTKLKTPEAKAELQRRWMEWKGLAA